MPTPNENRISVVMVNRNDSRWLPEAIESVQAQTYPDYELIIVDDASTDSSRVIIENAGSLDSRIKGIFLDAPSGISAGRNRGMDEATGKYISLLDSDDRMIPETLEEQIRAFQNARGTFAPVRLLSSDAFTINEAGKRCSRYMPANYWDRELFKGDAPTFTLPSTWFFEKSPALRFNPAWLVGEAPAFIEPIAERSGVYFVGKPLVEYRWRLSSVTNDRAKSVLRAMKAAQQTTGSSKGWAEPVFPDQVTAPKWNEILGWKYGRSAQSALFNGKPLRAVIYLAIAAMAQPRATGSKIKRGFGRLTSRIAEKAK